jgi:hypothetical protein
MFYDKKTAHNQQQATTATPQQPIANGALVATVGGQRPHEQ